MIYFDILTKVSQTVKISYTLVGGPGGWGVGVGEEGGGEGFDCWGGCGGGGRGGYFSPPLILLTSLILDLVFVFDAIPNIPCYSFSMKFAVRC